MNYSFGKAGAGEIGAIFALYERRVRWMNEKGIRQWNATDYLDVYPVGYYENELSLGNLYAMKSEDRIVGAIVLLQSDERWPDRADSSAYYIHNLVTDPACPGAGRRIMEEAEKLAILHGKEYMRLDCAVDNSFLNHYYESLGYVMAGRCDDGDYHGNRREKKLWGGRG